MSAGTLLQDQYSSTALYTPLLLAQDPRIP